MFLIIFFLSLFQISNIDFNNNQTAILNLNNFKSEDQIFINLNSKEISAEVVLIKELKGKTLFAKNSNLEKPIASLTKLMSSYLIYNLFPPNALFSFDQESINQPGEVGYFYPGENITRNEALKASLVSSSNDSIYLLAKNYGLDKFITLMNEKAKEFGMMQTKFNDPSGISPNNISTAYDLYLLSENIYELAPEIFNFTTLEKIVINNKILWTTNLLLPKYKDIIVGAKTGFTPEAGECLLLIVKFKNSPFINIIILNSQDRFNDAEKIITVLKEYYDN